MTYSHRQSRSAYRWLSTLAAALLLVPGCSVNDLLDIEDPDIVNPNDLRSAAGAAAAYAGGIGDFSLAVVGNNGGTEGQILTSGLFTDEYIHSGTFPTRLEYELRAIDERNGTLDGVFRNLQRARATLEDAIDLLQTYAPTPASRIGEMFALAGLTYDFFGENYCSGVPFGSLATGPGIPRTTTEIFNLAIERFDSASTYADPQIANLAAVGKARALVDLGDYSTAATTVSGVPTNFVYQTTHTTTTGRQQNGVHVFNYISERWSVADNEGTNGLDFRSANDPRVQVDTGGVGFDATTLQWNLTKYPTRTTPVPIAGGIEARLIEAEAQLAAGGTTWLTTLNTLRADSANNGGFNLSALADPGTPAGRVDLLFRERAFWLFATGHRLGDMRRLLRQYGRTAGQVYPTGTHFKGTLYGSDVNFPVPFSERNNPNFTGCSTTTP